jgi:hypothetical protein
MHVIEMALTPFGERDIQVRRRQVLQLRLAM